MNPTNSDGAFHGHPSDPCTTPALFALRTKKKGAFQLEETALNNNI